MNPGRDRKLRRELLILCAAGLLLGILGLFLSPLLSLGLVIGTGLTLLIHLAQIRARNRSIQQLNRELARILQGDAAVQMADYQEGELAVLQCELEKLLLQLRRSNEAMAEEQQLLSDALADISHQLRTPLTSMELILTRLRTQELSEAERRRLLLELLRLLGRTEWLIEALLKLSRLDTGTVKLRKEPISLQKLLSLSVQPLAVAMELRDQELVLPAQDAEIICDPQWTAEAIGNLLKNAMEHTPCGGRIIIETDCTALYTQLLLRDSGPGFAPEDLPHLFERFYRGKNAAAGSFGIGLSLARRIFSEQDCTLKASNHPSGGAAFTIRFFKSTV